MKQTSLSGRHDVLMDQRGRLSFPAIYRAIIGDVLYVTPDQNYQHILVVRSQEEFDAECERLEEECKEKGMDKEDTVDVIRYFTMNTASLVADKNGRVTIPAKLVNYAGLSGKVAAVGVGKFVELWNEDTLNAYEAEFEKLQEQKRKQKDAEKAARLLAEK